MVTSYQRYTSGFCFRTYMIVNYLLMLAIAMYCTFGKTNNHHAYFFNGCQINDACIVSDFGIEIDSSLKCDAHTNILVMPTHRVGVLFKGFTIRHVPVLRKAFLAIVRPVLEYASNVWAPYLMKHINARKRKFRKILRSVSPLSPTYRTLNA